MIVKRLSWDSDFFGLRIGRADVSSEKEALALTGQSDLLRETYDLIYVFASHDCEFHATEAKLVDKKVVYSLADSTQAKPCNNVAFWDCNKGMTEDLLYLALVSGKYSRFKLDGRFPAGSFERLYSRWIEQSVNHSMASEVFCYMIESIPRGIVTLDYKNGIGTIGLVAIHEDFQQRGIGTAMMRHVISYSNEKQMAKLNVATQLDNNPACRLYEKNGFEVETVTDVWHWWL